MKDQVEETQKQGSKRRKREGIKELEGVGLDGNMDRGEKLGES